LVASGKAYYAFDTPQELEERRNTIENFTYNYLTRTNLRNSLTLPEAEVDGHLAAAQPRVIRLRVEPGRAIHIHDLIRGEVVFQSDELDDKVLLKADGMPTYHLANIVDDHLMKITHVIRGEEWLPSTAHHVLLYEAFGWADTMPKFSHLPLIMKPVGNGKLSKRDGAKFGIPVFPLSWPLPGESAAPEDHFLGFREAGFLPAAVINFLALLGWHPGGDQEMFTLDELVQAFSLEHISKGGARFDYEKARWFNQKYLQMLDNPALAAYIRPLAERKGYAVSEAYLVQVAGLMKERVSFLPDFVEMGYYLFEPVRDYDRETIAKKWKPEWTPVFERLIDFVAAYTPFNGPDLETAVKQFVTDQGAKPGDLLPLLRVALAGTMKGPAIFDMAVTLGQTETVARLRKALAVFNGG
ncbi:MAG: glutamate--tRNA ligase family protein, partial [Saprospiraceae bacterium]